MKGLLKKDLSLLAGYGRVYLVIAFFSIVLGLVNKDMQSYSLSFMILILSLAGMSTFSYDEFENGLPYLMTLAVKRKTYVREKYVLCMAGGLMGIIFSLIVGGAVFRIHPFQGGGDSLAAALFSFFITSGIMIAVMIPAKIKFGPEKSRVVAFGLIMIVWILGFLGKIILEAIGVEFEVCLGYLEKFSDLSIVLCMILFYCLILCISYIYSVHTLEKMEF